MTNAVVSKIVLVFRQVIESFLAYVSGNIRSLVEMQVQFYVTGMRINVHCVLH
jgi:hypothetical protein